MAVPIYVPNNNEKVFPFLHALFITYCYRFFGDGHSDWREVIPHCSLDSHFSNNE